VLLDDDLGSLRERGGVRLRELENNPRDKSHALFSIMGGSNALTFTPFAAMIEGRS
jgi:hypothetical protein